MSEQNSIWDNDTETRFQAWDKAHPFGTLYGEVAQKSFSFPFAPAFIADMAVSKPPLIVISKHNKGGRPAIPLALDLSLFPGSLREKAEQAGVSYSTVRRRLKAPKGI